MNFKFKLSFGEPRYLVNEEKKVVTCLIKYHLKGTHKGIMQVLSVMDTVIKNDYRDNIFRDEFIVNAQSKLHPGDEFDVEIGKKIARAKAESSAYEFTNNCLQKIYNEFVKITEKAATEFDFNTENVIYHNEKYIKKF